MTFDSDNIQNFYMPSYNCLLCFHRPQVDGTKKNLPFEDGSPQFSKPSSQKKDGSPHSNKSEAHHTDIRCCDPWRSAIHITAEGQLITINKDQPIQYTLKRESKSEV